MSIGLYEAVATSSNGSTKKAVADENGYYKLIIGAFNIVNSKGEEYIYDNEVAGLFNKGGAIRNRIERGLLRGELGHPDVSRLPVDEAIARLNKVVPLTTCVHFKDVSVVPLKDEKRKGVMAVYGELTPSGALGHVLKKQLENAFENVTFSVRSLAAKRIIRGITTKKMVDAIAYDYVDTPGIDIATKFDTMSLESYVVDDLMFTDRDLDKVITKSADYGFEHDDLSSLRMIKGIYGWQTVEVKTIKAFDYWK